LRKTACRKGLIFARKRRILPEKWPKMPAKWPEIRSIQALKMDQIGS
jgi:hypothetical protein